jgi:DNA-binding GntR family transcriptional regulator
MVRVAVIAQTTGTANASEQKYLRLGASERVVRVLRIRSENHRALSYELVVLPIRLFPNLTPDSEIASDIFGLARDHGVVLGIATERVRIVKATKDVAAHLGLTAGGWVMKFDRVVRTTEGLPVEWRIAFIAQS